MSAPTAPCAERDFVKKDQRSKCLCCNAGFGMTRWKYHCHMCGEVVCDNCSSGKLTLPPVWTAEPVRVWAQGSSSTPLLAAKEVFDNASLTLDACA